MSEHPRAPLASANSFGFGGFTPLERQQSQSESRYPPTFAPSNPNSPSASPYASPAVSRRGSMAQGHVGGGHQHPLADTGSSPALSRRSSHSTPHPFSTGPRPVASRRDPDSGSPAPPSLLSRAGSPTLPLMTERSKSRRGSFVDGQHPNFGQGLGGFGMSSLDEEGKGSKRKLKVGDFVASVDCGTTSTRFIVFDKYAHIIAEHQSDLPLYHHHPHPGHHELSPRLLLQAINECIDLACAKLEFVGYDANKSIKGIGITNQRETTICWDKKTGRVLGRKAKAHSGHYTHAAPTPAQTEPSTPLGEGEKTGLGDKEEHHKVDEHVHFPDNADPPHAPKTPLSRSQSLSRTQSLTRTMSSRSRGGEGESQTYEEEGRGLIWDDTRTVAVVREAQRRLEEEGLVIEPEDEVAFENVKRQIEEAEKEGRGKREDRTAKRAREREERAKAKVGAKEVEEAKAQGPGILDKLISGLGLASDDKDEDSPEEGEGLTAPGGEPEKEIVETTPKGEKKTKTVRKGSDALVDITGIPLSTYFSALKLRWMIDHNHEIKEAYDEDRLAFGTVDSWIVYNLTGGKDNGLHIIDISNASRTLLFNIHTLEWSPTLLNFFGFKRSVLPTIVSSSEVYGKICAGPLKDVPIAGMIGDQQAALVGNKCLSRGEAKNTYGTGAFVLFNTGNEVVRSREGLISTVAYQLGRDKPAVYALEGSIAVAGSAIKWLRDQVGLIDESSEMDLLCSSVEDTGGVYFVTGFSGLLAPYWDPNASGTIIGLTQYSTSAHIARAILEAVCYQTRAVLDVIEHESGVKLEELKVDGGVTNSDLAMQIQADIGGFRICRPSMRESTALGSALLAGSALGLFGWDLNNPETLSEVNTDEASYFEPQIDERMRAKWIRGWERAVERAKAWHTEDEEDEYEAELDREEEERSKQT